MLLKKRLGEALKDLVLARLLKCIFLSILSCTLLVLSLVVPAYLMWYAGSLWWLLLYGIPFGAAVGIGVYLEI